MNPLLLHRIAALVLAACGLAGCASPYRTALSAPVTELGSTSTIVCSDQHEIGTSIRPSTGGGIMVGGLVGALVDSAVNATSAGRMETAAAELRQSLLSYDFPASVQKALSDRFAADTGFRTGAVRVIMERDERSMDAMLKQADGDAVLVVVLDYRMDPDFSQVVVTADAYLCARSEDLRKKAVMQSYGGVSLAVLYRNSFQSAWSLPEGVLPGDGRESMASIWASQEGQPARDVLDRASIEIASMLAWDLAEPAAADYRPAKGQGRMVQLYRNGTTLGAMGAETRTDSGRSWVRLADGRMAAY